ncbi:hypothetical protein [Bradyrhizobium oligotrophicum]
MADATEAKRIELAYDGLGKVEAELVMGCSLTSPATTARSESSRAPA